MDTGKQILDKIEEMYNLKDADGKQKNKVFFSHLTLYFLLCGFFIATETLLRGT